MNIVADMSLYPLKDGPVPEIIAFIRKLRERDGLEVVTNQLSTQLRGDFDAVTSAINECMREVTPDMVLGAARELLSRGGGESS